MIDHKVQFQIEVLSEKFLILEVRSAEQWEIDEKLFFKIGTKQSSWRSTQYKLGYSRTFSSIVLFISKKDPMLI